MARERSVADADDDVEPSPLSPAVQRLSAVVRRIYILLRVDLTGSPFKPGPSWDGGTTAFGRRYKPVWPSIAEFMLRNGAEPLSYLRAQFWHADPEKPPRASQLKSQFGLDLYERYRVNVADATRNNFARELNAIRAEMLPLQDALRWDHSRALRCALSNERSVSASPLTRYCLAMEYGHYDIAESFYDRALLQYAFQKQVYDAVLPAGTIPQRLCTEAESMIRSMLT
jgi:hypothetical protein